MTGSIAITELVDARANAVFSMLELARIEIERNATLAAIAAYSGCGRYQLRRLKSTLELYRSELRDDQLFEVAMRLERVPDLLRPTLARVDREMGKMAVFERCVMLYMRNSIDEVSTLVYELKAEAAKGQRPSLSIEGPRLSLAMRRQAAIASTLLRPVHPDPAEAYPDPDYGL
jgi:hypothetical protein